MFLYQKTGRYFAQVADDIKDLARDELVRLGAKETRPVYRGIHFSATLEVLYRVNYHARLLQRILAPLDAFRCHSDRYLYKRAGEIPWDRLLEPEDTFSVFASVSNSTLRHSKFAALRLKDAVVDQFRARTGKRPSVDKANPDLWINLHVENDRATISVDTSGGPLHRRGYRKLTVEAPMQETLAAALITHAQWTGQKPLYDPFCGSGTILCEAYLMASRTPAGILRKRFGFQRLPDFDPVAWERVEKQASKGITIPPKGLVSGSDHSAAAVRASSRNCAAIDPAGRILISRRDVFDLKSLEGRAIICNPPYGIRSEKHTDLSEFYARFGDFLKRRCQGAQAFIYFGDRRYIKCIGLRPSWKRPLSNGGLDGRLVKIELY
ncbi:MAG: class I SAM-dependent RNA methyltransferase [Deltaproteobacteria bacterium]|nr:class I SAM-dependent RNA methyltransferase [Deltaproteobacteria bacterium]MBW1921988.1 class I SAM-dependent RNA methyltransferase [Deltaproteobacteria bacterium]MBW1950156.1 class I SAM-dependent RNA methyltransferase [Deltaproteobacteria bacterium]MBW2008118.1 class I SAM-dependent RNA methyltransferase [Deltaproteobacteria bacterium]MBW2102967.1 class I SAM-dependent RNA methyltransferase [Deltaproteobacteria bacterium]